MSPLAGQMHSLKLVACFTRRKSIKGYTLTVSGL